MGVIAVRVNDSIENKLRENAKVNGMTISEYCRSLLSCSQPQKEEVLQRATIESEIDKLKREQEIFTEAQVALTEKIGKNAEFFNHLLYTFFALGYSAEKANEVWNKALEKVSTKEGE